MHASIVLCAGFLGEMESGALDSRWDHMFILVSILFLGAFSLSWLLYCYQDSLLSQGQGAQRVGSASGWVTRVSSMVKRAQSSIF